MQRLAQRLFAVGWLGLVGTLTGCHTVQTTGYRIDPGVTGYSSILGCVAQRYVYPEPLVERALTEAMADLKIHSVRRVVKHEGELIVLLGLTYDGRAVLRRARTAGEPYGRPAAVRRVRRRTDVEPAPSGTSVRIATLPHSVSPPFDPRALSDSVTHRGENVMGYRGVPLR